MFQVRPVKPFYLYCIPSDRHLNIHGYTELFFSVMISKYISKRKWTIKTEHIGVMEICNKMQCSVFIRVCTVSLHQHAWILFDRSSLLSSTIRRETTHFDTQVAKFFKVRGRKHRKKQEHQPFTDVTNKICETRHRICPIGVPWLVTLVVPFQKAKC